MVISESLCIELDQLEAFTLGRLSDAKAIPIESHLSGCQFCLSRLQRLTTQDTLVEAFHAQATVVWPTIDPKLVDQAMESAQRLYRAAGEAPEPEYAVDALIQLGDYRLLRLLGKGGMGVVFEAEDLRLKRRVAVKALAARNLANRDAHARFLRESRAIAGLMHHNIVPIHYVGEDKGIPFFVMPLLEGETLETKLRREGILPSHEISRIGIAIADGLAAAHRRRIVHRDIKPANVWLESDCPTGSVKLLDFGLAHDEQEDIHLTQEGTLIGTPAFMSPEQASGSPVDVRSDLFSLGTVLYFAGGGMLPFAAPTALATLRAIVDDTPRSLAELNPKLPARQVAIIEKLHAKDPSQRYASAEEVSRDLRRLLETNDLKASRSRRPWSRGFALVAGLLLAVIVLGVTVAAGITQLSRPHLQGSAPTVAPAEGGAAADSEPADKDKPTVYPVALLTFEERGARDTAGKVADLLFAKLASNENLYLVDRVDLKKVLAEAELNLSGAVKASEATRVGQLTGAKLLVTGSVIQVEKKLILVAKVIGTETSRIAGVSVEGKTSDDLSTLVDQLAGKLGETIPKKAEDLVARRVTTKDRIAAIKAKMKKGDRPVVMIQIGERHVGLPRIDPAAQTELTLLARETGFTVVDDESGSKSKADYLIKGEGISETAARNGNLVTVKSRVELKVVDRKTDLVVAADRQTVLVVDLAEQIAGKSGLEEAAAQIAERLLPKLVK
jgi:serine/threonine protein kinase/TolB-like protein